MIIKRKIIEIDPERCDGCGLCVPSCAEGAIQIIDGKATLTAEKYCDGLGACLGECPNDALHIIERESEDFDEHGRRGTLEGHKTSRPLPSLKPSCPAAALPPRCRPLPRSPPVRKPTSRRPKPSRGRPSATGRYRSSWCLPRRLSSRTPTFWWLPIVPPWLIPTFTGIFSRVRWS